MKFKQTLSEAKLNLNASPQENRKLASNSMVEALVALKNADTSISDMRAYIQMSKDGKLSKFDSELSDISYQARQLKNRLNKVNKSMKF